MVLKHRTAFKIKMTIEQLQKMILAAQNAAENMLEGQTFTIEVDPRVDFVFEDLKTFKSFTAITRETAEEHVPLV